MTQKHPCTSKSRTGPKGWEVCPCDDYQPYLRRFPRCSTPGCNHIDNLHGGAEHGPCYANGCTCTGWTHPIQEDPCRACNHSAKLHHATHPADQTSTRRRQTGGWS